ncbi:hypothetical protein M422DRAFT_243584 [Sphaerobolus stellatus SS14]|nr:hypothetical protein M422DRAFT_243584 [Sphaerobolus stellatus SS14]
MSNNESNNALVRMVKYMLDLNINTTMEKSPLAKAGVKVTPPDKYSEEQSFEALKIFVKGSLRWLDMHSMLGPDVYNYQVLFLGRRLEGKALEWFDKRVEPGSTKKFRDNLHPGLCSLLLCAGYDSEKKMIHKLYLKAVKLEDTNHYDIGVRNSEPMTCNSQQDNNILSNARHKPRNNAPDRTRSHIDPPKSGEISKGPSITPGSSEVNKNSSNTPVRAGLPIHNRQQMNHKSSHNSIECYNCGKSGHIKPNCPESLRACHIGAVHVKDAPEEQVDHTDCDIDDVTS